MLPNQFFWISCFLECNVKLDLRILHIHSNLFTPQELFNLEPYSTTSTWAAGNFSLRGKLKTCPPFKHLLCCSKTWFRIIDWANHNAFEGNNDFPLRRQCWLFSLTTQLLLISISILPHSPQDKKIVVLQEFSESPTIYFDHAHGACHIDWTRSSNKKNHLGQIQNCLPHKTAQLNTSISMLKI